MELDAYLKVSAEQLVRRSQALLAVIPRDLPPEYSGLTQICRTRLATLMQGCRAFERMLSESQGLPPRWPLRTLRRLATDIEEIETIAVAVLANSRPPDHAMSSLLHQIAREIAYPASSVPVVATLSQSHFAIYPDFDLLLVPLVEPWFLLHLPDLYHELSHPLLEDPDDPILSPFREAYDRVAGAGHIGFREQEILSQRSRNPRSFADRDRALAAVWLTTWPKEFFCDLFATAVLGPAYGWSHLHLFAKRGGNPYRIDLRPMSHPADAARMDVIQRMLVDRGYGTEAAEIATSWNALVQNLGDQPAPEYAICYPSDLLTMCVEEVRNALIAMRCRLAEPGSAGDVRDALNEAWRRLRSDPDGFAAWERQTIDRLLPT